MQWHGLPYYMHNKNPIPIASIAFLRRWQRIHRKMTGKTARRRHVYMAKILALAGLTPEQVAIVTAHQAQVETYCCDFVAEHIAATLRPSLFATVILQSLGEGKPMILGDSDSDEVEAAMKAIGEGKPTKRKKA